MPELPEVETIRRTLAPRVLGCRVYDVSVRAPHVLHGINSETFREELTGLVFSSSGRRGKYLLFGLVDDSQKGPSPESGVGESTTPMVVLGFHLRMTGRLLLHEPKQEPEKHVHLLLHLGPAETSKVDRVLHFRDVRKFGRVFLGPLKSLPAAAQPAQTLLNEAERPYLSLMAAQAIEQRQHKEPRLQARWPKGLGELGPEPLTGDFSAAYLQKVFKGRRAPIKALLLNQQVVAGLGNIYVDEALFRSRVRPDRPASEVSRKQLELLVQSVRDVLDESIKGSGTTFSDYRDGYGEAGRFYDELLVYGRGGQACMTCGSTLRSCRVAGRGTVYCARCQK